MEEHRPLIIPAWIRFFSTGREFTEEELLGMAIFLQLVFFWNSRQHSFSGTSSKGCLSWKGRDKQSGATAFLTNWDIHHDHFQLKCPMSCEYIAKPEKCQGHKFNLFSPTLAELVEKAKYLIRNVKHKNLVRYLGLNVYYKQNIVRIQVAQEYIEGDSIRNLCQNGQLVNVAAIGKEVLESIVYVQNKPTEVTHGYLNDKSIFLDKSGTCRVSDYDLIPYLMYLKGHDILHKESDVSALGTLITQLRDVILKSTNDFIDECHSGRVIHSSDLRKHHFLSNNWYCHKKERKSSHSIENFQILSTIGHGSFGTVLKAKQEVDKKLYALKIIEMPENKNEYEKAAREAELISRINHRNVVRNITSWKQENVNLAEFRKQYSLESDDDFDDESMVTDSSFV